jgi:hypothetical protein
MIPQVAYPHSVGIAPIASLSQERCRHATMRLKLAKPFHKTNGSGGRDFSKMGGHGPSRATVSATGGHGPSPRNRERTALGVSKIRYIYYLSMCRLEPHVRRGRSF